MAPVKLFGDTMSWNVTRCVVALEEAGADYEIAHIDFSTREHKSPEHLARNALVRFRHFKMVIYTSRNHAQFAKHACRKYRPELLKASDRKESAMVDVWLEVEAHQYNAALHPIIFEILIRPILGGTCDRNVVDENLEKLKNVLEIYEARLAKTKYLAGDFISLADLNHVSATLCLFATPYASVLDAYPHVKAWWDGLVARPSAQKAAALMKPSA